MLYVLLIVSGAAFILWQLFFSSGGKAKFKSDLPVTKEAVKKKKVVVACSLILSVLTLVLLVLTVISFLS